MSHIHTTEGAYDHTASAFIIKTDGIEPKLLLHRHKKLDAYLQFGGHVEINENPWQAVAHEITEESGYALSQLQVLQPPITLPEFEGQFTLIHPHPMAIVSHPFNLTLKHFHTDTSWVFNTDQDPLSAPGESESKQIIGFTKEELEKISDKEIFENIRLLGLYALDVCLQEWQPVPAERFRV